MHLLASQNKSNLKFLVVFVQHEYRDIMTTQPAFTFSKLTKETLEQSVKYIQS